MASAAAKPRITGGTLHLAHLWQVPLLLISVGLFGAAAYFFIHPGQRLTIERKIDIARLYLNYNRPEAALDQLNKLLTTERLTPANEGRVHLMLAEALEQAQTQHHISLRSNHERIIEQTRLAMGLGVKPDPETYRRLGDSYEALGDVNKALESYRGAIAMDARRFPHLQRKVIELQLAQPDKAPAEAAIDEYLKEPKLADSERAWGLRQRGRLLVDRGSFLDAKSLFDQSMRLTIDPASRGESNYWLGFCLWKMGDGAEAERLLRVARDQLKTAQPLDADAAYVLGKIRQQQNDPKEAISFYQAVLTSHPESAVARLARLGRGACRITVGEDAPGLSDMHELVNHMMTDEDAGKDTPEVVAGMRQAVAILSSQEKFASALELLGYEKMLEPTPPPAEFLDRVAGVYEHLADQVEQALDAAPDAVQKLTRQQKVRKYRTLAADAYIAYSQSLTVSDDKEHADAMWKGVELYDRAGDLQMVTSALEMYAAERPEDGQTPDALLRLGRAYQAMGLFDKAIAAFERNELRYPQSLAASKSGVPLAQAYIAKGPEFYPRAEKVLQNVLQSPMLSPEAEEFGQSLFELAQLYYRTGRYEEAVQRLDEMISRYPNDQRMPQLVFLEGDSYRKSAAGLLAANPTGNQASQADNLATRNERLGKARKLYDRLVDMFRDREPSGDLDKLYLKLAYFYRGDCLFALRDFGAAIGAYDAAAMRYKDDASALSAYVQIVNAYCEQRDFGAAKHANERAMTLLSRMPPEAFTNGAFSMPREYWQQWLKWTNDAGLWNGLEDEKQAAERFAGAGQ
ncbi:MAG TPA: tetratricopeptide repeat protein [Tepidisphaeraceae bacterium]|nr:tetratricopeptide repeat protein [Tepidisphaeraceae bacterium]